MISRFGLPPVEELRSAPELAVLALLDVALDALVLSLHAAHPHHLEPDPPPLEVRAARELEDVARDIIAAGYRYRIALALAREQDDCF